MQIGNLINFASTQPLRMQSVQANRPIIHVIGATVAGGAEIFVMNLAIAQRQSGQMVHIVTLSNRADAAGSAMQKKLADAGVHLSLGPSIKVGVETLLWYRKVINQLRPFVIHLHTPNTEIAHWLGMLGVPKTWSLYRTLHNTKTRGEISPMARAAITFNRTMATVACGNEVAVTARTFISSPIHCIPNGIDFYWPVQDVITRKAARFRLQLEQDAIHFVNVGRMSAESFESLPKAQDVLLRAWQKLDGKQKIFLHLLGDGSLRHKLAALVTDDRTVKFHGVRPDIADWLMAADVFVMPSRWEGLPIAGIEAVGTGIRCIFSDIAPLRELSNSDVIWAKPGDVDATFNALRSAIDGQAKRTKNEVAAFRKQYSIATVAARYNALYASHTGQKIMEGIL